MEHITNMPIVRMKARYRVARSMEFDNDLEKFYAKHA